MNIISRTYADASPSFTSTLQPPTPSYPTTPQSCPHTEVMSINSPPPTGLGLLNYAAQSANAQLAMCSPPESLIPPSPVWQHANNCFTGPPSQFPGYPALALYHDLQTVPNTTSAPPYSMPSTHNDTTSTFGFLSPAQTVKRHASPIPQCNAVAHSISPDYRASSAHRRSPVIKQELDQDWDRMTTGGSLGTSLLPVEDFPFVQNSSVSGPPRQNNVDNGMLLRVTPSMDRDTGNRQSPQSLTSTTRAGGIGTSSMRANSGRKTTKKARCLPNGKYECDQCGKQFTRNSNCRSHMKIHDPNRKYPHKCTFSQCTKKFSRKTDLIRHIDSVHKKLRRFGCNQCGYYFARQDTLRRHREDGCRRRQQQQNEIQRQLPTTSTISISVSNDAIMAYPANSTTYQGTALFADHQPQLTSTLLPNTYLDNDPETFSDFSGY